MNMKKLLLNLLKLIGIIGAIAIVANVVMALIQVFKVKSRQFDEELVSIFDEKAFDMAEQNTEVTAVSMFSATTFDYRNAPELDEPYVLELEAMYTGVEIIVPDGWFVESKGTIAMAGMDNTTLTYDAHEPRLKVKVNAKFAGIEIRNLD